MLLHMIGSQRIAKRIVKLAVWLATRGGAANSAARRSHGRLSKMQLAMLRTHLHFNDDSRDKFMSMFACLCCAWDKFDS